MRELEGRNAIVTGGRGGIGRAIVERFISEGSNVWICSRTHDPVFEGNISAHAREASVSVRYIYADLSNEEDIKDTFIDILKEKKNIDILVNNAGISTAGMLAMQTMRVFRDMFDVNFFAPMYISQLISKNMMRNHSGNIVNIASVSGCENHGGNIAYGASKAALIWATKELAKELAPFGIRVNAVSPGATDTAMRQSRSEIHTEQVLQRTALKRIAEPREIAEAVLYLVSARASYITGHNLIVDGGRLDH